MRPILESNASADEFRRLELRVGDTFHDELLEKEMTIVDLRESEREPSRRLLAGAATRAVDTILVTPYYEERGRVVRGDPNLYPRHVPLPERPHSRYAGRVALAKEGVRRYHELQPLLRS